MTLRQLGLRAGLSLGAVQSIETGAAGSIDAYVRLATALGMRLDVELADPRRRLRRTDRPTDVVHSAMGEFQAGRFRRLGFAVAIDEPYQHYQFAGRADLVAWDLPTRSLIHIENRTRFPDFQEMAGSFNAKRAYLGRVLAERLGLNGWVSETHVIAALWSAEVLHALRLRSESFRALVGGDSGAFERWWTGSPPAMGRTATLIILDPLASGRHRPFVGLDGALTARPRYRGYADAASAMIDGRE